MIATCKELVELVTEYLDGGLEPADRLAFERHVSFCPPCRGYLAQMQKLSRSASGLREDDLPPELRERALAAFRRWRDER